MPAGPKVEHKSFGQEIVIRDVDHSDKGKYECSAVNRVTEPVSREFTVHVECKCRFILLAWGCCTLACVDRCHHLSRLLPFFI